MKKILGIASMATFCSLTAMADSWSGKLLDATCYDQQKKAASCPAASSTTAFMLDVAGKVFRLDEAGNTKASAALKNRADRSANPSLPPAAEILAKVTGSEKDGTITVEMIEVR